ncbi:MAG: hypothetical protein K6T80_07125 [Firmicutes bacterium]|nr:hypothetical protein [Bacillota bacterium]
MSSLELKRVRLQTLARVLSGKGDLTLMFAREASTDLKNIRLIYFDNQIVPGVPASREECWVSLKATCAHEAGHIRFTSKGVWEKARRVSRHLAHVLNIVEDARIERCMANAYPGTLLWFRFANDYIFTHRRDWGTGPKALISGLISYAVVGRVPGQVAEQKEVMELLTKCAPIIDAGRMENNTEGAYARAVEIWDIIKDCVVSSEPPPVPVSLGTDSPEESPAGELDPRRKPVLPEKPPEESSENPEEDKKSEAPKPAGLEELSGELSEPAEKTDVSGEPGGEPEETSAELPDASPDEAPVDSGEFAGDSGELPDEASDDSPCDSGELPDEASDDSPCDSGELSDEASDDFSGDSGEFFDNHELPDDSGETFDDFGEPPDDFGDSGGFPDEALDGPEDSGEDVPEDDVPGEPGAPEFGDSGTGSLEGLSDDGFAGGPEAPGELPDSGGEPDEPGFSEEPVDMDEYVELLESAGEELSGIEEASSRLEKAEASCVIPDISEGEMSAELSKGMHEGCVFVLKKDLVPVPRRRYDEIYLEIKAHINKTVAEIRKVLEYKSTFIEKNLRKGRVHSGSLWKLRVKDPKIFCRVSEPDDIPRVVFYLLVDCSGSMAGRNMVQARKSACLLYEVCSQLKVPVNVTGFTSEVLTWTDVTHFRAVNFGDPPDKKYLIPRLEAMDQNRDGYSIRVATKELLLRNEEKKVLIVLSDGMPCAGYRDYGVTSLAVKDTALAVREAEKKNVGVIGLYFGRESDLPRARMIYNNLIYVRDISVLPLVLARVVKKVISGL